MRTIEHGGRTYHLPADEVELCALVRQAAAEGRPLRVRGSGHSFPAAIYEPDGEGTALDVLLDDYGEIEAYGTDPQTGRPTVTVQAGCRLTRAPRAHGDGKPGDLSRPWWKRAELGLLERLHEKGLALDDLGGITHQTVGGFVSTGSAGGSIQFPLAIRGFRVIDANGEVHRATPTENPDLFHAAGTSMGLLGVISAVTFQCTDRYFVAGTEEIVKVEQSPIDLFGEDGDSSGRPSLSDFLRETEYARLLWWPQPGVEKLTIWKAHRITPEEFQANPRKYGTPERFRRRPYVEIGMRYCNFLRPGMPVIGWIRRKFHRTSSWVQQALAGLIYALLGTKEPAWYQKPWVALARRYETQLINLFTQEEQPQEFWDTWWQGLPMDNQISDRFLPTWFTELWVPIDRTQEVTRKLREMYAGMTLEEMGAFSVEIYAGAPESFWLHPSAGAEAVRIDVFWFGKNQGDPRSLYRRFWQELEPFGYRAHWGKYVPELTDPQLRALYPQLDRFRGMRAERDPQGIFASSYWHHHLHLAGG